MSLSSELKKFVVGKFDLSKIYAASLANPPQWLIDSFSGGAVSKSGINVSETSALQSTAVLKCVKVIAETIASLPFNVYENLETNGKRKATNHYLYKILHDLVNPLMTSFEWREVSIAHLLLWGNCYAEIERNNGNYPIALWPLRPDRMEVRGDKFKLRYIYTLPSGERREILAENVLHVKGLSLNGYVGQSVISYIRNSVGLSLAIEDFASRFFENDATPTFVVKHPMTLSEPAKKNIEESLEDRHQGLTKKHRFEILEEGMSIEQLGMPLQDAQFIETRKFQDVDIAGVYRVPPHKIGILDRATFSNIEHQAIEFVVDTIRPWAVRIEQAIKRDLFFQNEGTFFVSLVLDGLLRGDIKSRYDAYKVAREWGWYSANDILELEDRNPIGEQGDVYLVPMNYKDARSLLTNPSGESTEGRFSLRKTRSAETVKKNIELIQFEANNKNNTEGNGHAKD